MNKICTIPGCHKPFLARGYCSKHYTQFRKHGDPLALVQIPRGEQTGWMTTTAAYKGDDCVLWPFKSTFGKKRQYGYARFRGRNVGAHRMMCIMVHGEQPSPTHEVAHSCGNSLCVTPRHLRWATPTENAYDKRYHGTHRRGSQTAVAKLTEHEALAIFNMKGGGTHEVIGRMFGVSRENVGAIQRGITWGWLTAKGNK